MNKTFSLHILYMLVLVFSSCMEKKDHQVEIVESEMSDNAILDPAIDLTNLSQEELFPHFIKVINNHCLSCHSASGNAPGNFWELGSISAWENSAYINEDGILGESPIFYRLKGAGEGKVENMPIGRDISRKEFEIVQKFVQSFSPTETDFGKLTLTHNYNNYIEGEVLETEDAYLNFIEPGILISLKNLSNLSVTIEDIHSSNNQFSIVNASSEYINRVIEPGEVFLLKLKLASTQAGDFDSTVLITSNSNIAPFQEILVKGKIIDEVNCSNTKLNRSFEIKTNTFLKYAILDLLGIEIDNIEDHLPVNISNGQRKHLVQGKISTDFILSYTSLINKVEDVLFEASAHAGLSKVNNNTVTCDLGNILSMSDSSFKACFENTYKPLLKRSLGKGYSYVVMDDLLSVVDQSLDNNEDKMEIMKAGVSFLLLNPHFLIYFEDDAVQITEHDYVKQVYSQLWNSVPTLDDAQSAIDSSFFSARQTKVQAILTNNNFYQRGLDSFFNYYLYKDKISSEMTIKGIDQNIADSLWESYSKGQKDIYYEESSATKLLTNTEIYLNSDIATFIGSNYGNPALTKEQTSDYIGAHRHPAFLALTAKNKNSQEEPLAPKRGNYINNMFYCKTFNAAQPNNLEIHDLPNSSFKDTFTNSTSGSSCIACHKTLNAFGFALHDKDFYGKTRSMDTYNFPIDTSGELMGLPFQDSAELGLIIAGSRKFQSCFGGHVFNYLSRDPDVGEHRCYVDKAIGIEQNLSMKEYFYKLLTDDKILNR
ncbi:DUF1588 domain-containing protein [Bacteriovoracaceae bacterium]|nr:DUF1588 domain-containing protein [Bacteriovoracaceae bacterium]